jgi:hypothetical protein
MREIASGPRMTSSEGRRRDLFLRERKRLFDLGLCKQHMLLDYLDQLAICFDRNS